jgi:hypothetical protein
MPQVWHYLNPLVNIFREIGIEKKENSVVPCSTALPYATSGLY